MEVGYSQIALVQIASRRPWRQPQHHGHRCRRSEIPTARVTDTTPSLPLQMMLILRSNRKSLMPYVPQRIPLVSRAVRRHLGAIDLNRPTCLCRRFRTFLLHCKKFQWHSRLKFHQICLLRHLRYLHCPRASPTRPED